MVSESLSPIIISISVSMCLQLQSYSALLCVYVSGNILMFAAVDSSSLSLELYMKPPASVINFGTCTVTFTVPVRPLRSAFQLACLNTPLTNNMPTSFKIDTMLPTDRVKGGEKANLSHKSIDTTTERHDITGNERIQPWIRSHAISLPVEKY